MIKGNSCSVDTSNPFLNRKWYGTYVFDPAATPPEKRAEDYVACVKNMFHTVTMAYALTEKQQMEFMEHLYYDLREGLRELTQNLKESEGL